MTSFYSYSIKQFYKSLIHKLCKLGWKLVYVDFAKTVFCLLLLKRAVQNLVLRASHRPKHHFLRFISLAV